MTDVKIYELLKSLAQAFSEREETAVSQTTLEEGLKICATLMAHYAPLEDATERAPNLLGKPANRLPGWKEKKAKDLIATKLSEGVPVALVANECALSRSHFSRSFKNNTGYSPKEWVIQTRISRAKEMLMGSCLPLVQIGAECGFSDQSHFTRAFGKHVGVTPRKWRQMNSHTEQFEALSES